MVGPREVEPRGDLADPAVLARVLERLAQDPELHRVEESDRQREHERHDERALDAREAPARGQAARELDGERDREAGRDSQESVRRQQLVPVPQRGEFHARHHGEARLPAVEPDVGEVAAHDGHGQVLRERRQAQLPHHDEHHAERRRRDRQQPQRRRQNRQVVQLVRGQPRHRRRAREGREQTAPVRRRRVRLRLL